MGIINGCYILINEGVKIMATILIDNIDYNLTKFSGKKGVMYQITQYNEDDKRQEYVCLSEKQINRISKKIRSKK